MFNNNNNNKVTFQQRNTLYVNRQVVISISFHWDLLLHLAKQFQDLLD